MASITSLEFNIDTTKAHVELDKLAARAKQIKASLQRDGFLPAFFGFFGGRCTFFAIAFFVIGVYLTLIGKLTSEFVALAGVIQVLILAHSAKEDYHERNSPSANISVDVAAELKS